MRLAEIPHLKPIVSRKHSPLRNPSERMDILPRSKAFLWVRYLIVPLIMEPFNIGISTKSLSRWTKSERIGRFVLISNMPYLIEDLWMSTVVFS